MVFKDENYLISFGRMVAEHRRHKEYSQEYLAELCDLHRNTIARIERGMDNAAFTTISNICLCLGFESARLDHSRGIIETISADGYLEPIPENIVKEKLAGIIDTLRHNHSISREKLANHTGLHRNTIARIENGSCEALICNVLRLYSYFGVTLIEGSPAVSNDQAECTEGGVTFYCIDSSGKYNILLKK